MSVSARAAGNSAESFPTGACEAPRAGKDRARRGAGPADAGRLSAVDQKRFEGPLQASRRGRWSLALAAAGGAGVGAARQQCAEEKRKRREGCGRRGIPAPEEVAAPLPGGDTGTKPPESGIFGFMINISALLGVITMCIRYLLIEKQNESSHFIRSSCNVFSLCIGLMGCTGMGIVATFQELSVPSVHDIGALVAFGSGVVYITLQSIISYKSCPQWNTYL
ncbi:DNA damage-regulated autophagy modulator protein 1 isoform X4 [Lathamus discolor]